MVVVAFLVENQELVTSKSCFLLACHVSYFICLENKIYLYFVLKKCYKERNSYN